MSGRHGRFGHRCHPLPERLGEGEADGTSACVVRVWCVLISVAALVATVGMTVAVPTAARPAAADGRARRGPASRRRVHRPGGGGGPVAPGGRVPGGRPERPGGCTGRPHRRGVRPAGRGRDQAGRGRGRGRGRPAEARRSPAALAATEARMIDQVVSVYVEGDTAFEVESQYSEADSIASAPGEPQLRPGGDAPSGVGHRRTAAGRGERRDRGRRLGRGSRSGVGRRGIRSRPSGPSSRSLGPRWPQFSRRLRPRRRHARRWWRPCRDSVTPGRRGSRSSRRSRAALPRLLAAAARQRAATAASRGSGGGSRGARRRRRRRSPVCRTRCPAW